MEYVLITKTELSLSVSFSLSLSPSLSVSVCLSVSLSYLPFPAYSTPVLVKYLFRQDEMFCTWIVKKDQSAHCFFPLPDSHSPRFPALSVYQCILGYTQVLWNKETVDLVIVQNVARQQ